MLALTYSQDFAAWRLRRQGVFPVVTSPHVTSEFTFQTQQHMYRTCYVSHQNNKPQLAATPINEPTPRTDAHAAYVTHIPSCNAKGVRSRDSSHESLMPALKWRENFFESSKKNLFHEGQVDYGKWMFGLRPIVL